MTKIEKLRHLITVLESVERESKPFDMSQWYQETECSTAACAFGWASLDPVFQEEGLELVIMGGSFFWPSFGSGGGYGAASRFFEISYRTAYALFWSGSYLGYPLHPITPRDVIARVQSLILDTVLWPLDGGVADAQRAGCSFSNGDSS